MFKLLKFLPMIFKLQDVSKAYEEEKGIGKPWYLSRRFFGALLVVVFAFLSIQFGFDLKELDPNVIANHIVNAIQAFVGLYGAVMVLVGFFKKAK
jgi:hypothetical protein